MVAVQLDQLGDVQWGERLLLARRRSSIGLEEVAAAVSNVIPISYGTIYRLEKLKSAPRDARRRLVAFLALLVYGFDPGDFGLYSTDVPPGVDRAKLTGLLTRSKGFENPANLDGAAVGSRIRAARTANGIPATRAA